MGAGAEVFKIVGTIGLNDVNKTFKELDRLDKMAEGFAKKLGKLAKELDKVGLQLARAFTVPIAAATTALGALAVKTGDYADKLLGLEQSTGLATDTLQEFAHVATTAGGSSEALFSSLTALTGKLPDIAAGTGDASKAFHELGVNVLNADGSYRSMENILPEVISRLQGVDDITKRNILANDIFGKKTKEIAAILGMSAKEMATVRQEAHKLGLVTSREGLESANKFRIGVENLKGQMAALGREIAVSLMPVLNETLIPLIQTTVIPAVRWLGDAVQGLAGVFADLPHWIQTASIAMGAFIGTLGPLFLVLGKGVAMAKNSLVAIIPLLHGLKAGALGAGAAVQGLAATLGVAAGSIAAVAVALAGAIALFVELEEEAAIEKAKSLRATEAQLNTIRQTYYAQRVRMANEAAAEEADAEREKQEKSAALNEEWQNKLLQQSGNRIAILDAEYAAEIKKAEGNAAAKAAIDKYYTEERRREAQAVAVANQEWENKIQEQKVNAMKDGIPKIKAAAAMQLQALALEEAKQLTVAAENGEDTLKVQQYFENERVRINKEATDKITANTKNGMAAAATAAVSALNSLGSVLSTFSANDEKLVDRDYKRRKEAIEANVADEEKRAAQIAALDKEYDAKKLEIQRENAKREKALGIFNTIVNTAQAIVKALADLGPIAGPVMATVVGALGVAQTAAIVSTPEPFEAGAMIQGGRGGVLGLVGEGRSDELILPLDTGIDRLADRLLAAVGPGISDSRSVNVNIGTFIGNKQGITELVRRIQPVIASENRRRGVT